MNSLQRLLQGSALCLLLAVPAMSASAQSFSYDGNRWYEVEVTIFSQTPSPTVFPEVTDAEDLVLSYPVNTRQLAKVTDPLMIEEEPESPPTVEFDFSDQPQTVPAPDRIYGPARAPENDVVLLPDAARDPFTLLGADAAKFTRHNSRLRSAAGHRVLFHGVWRQPMANANQAIPVAISGGDTFSSHRELEGFLRFSFNVNRIDVNADLWLMSFSSATTFGRSGEEPVGKINVPLSPAVPRASSPPVSSIRSSAATSGRTEVSAATSEYQIDQVWRLKETRSMISGNLHYLDHPQMGMLVEVRPYQLPVQDSVQDNDF